MKKVFNSQILKFYTALFLRAFLLLAPVMLLFYQENGLTYKHLFLFQGIFYLTSILSEIPVGYLSDKFSRKLLLIWSFSIFLCITFIWLAFKGFWIILIGEIMYAISKVMLDNATSGYLYDYLCQYRCKKQMTKLYGYVNFYLAIGTAIAAIIGSLIYSHYGSSAVLWIEFVIILIGISLVLSLPNICKNTTKKLKYKNFLSETKRIYNLPQIKYYIYYSGLLTSFSILFALSFQPLMQKALFPVFMFGVIAFLNHGVRALSGLVSGFVQKRVNIGKMIIPLYFLYILGFVLIFIILHSKNIVFVTCLIGVICLIIGCQVLFTIMHVSRLHKFVEFDNRGSLMAINNLVSRGISAVILISSKFLMDKFNLADFYLVAFIIYLITCGYFMLKAFHEKV